MVLCCPTCNAALKQRNIEDVIVEQCQSCRGIWFDATELSSLVRTFDKTTVEEPRARPSNSIDCSIECPKCNAEIASSIYAYDSGIPISKCSACGGVWLVDGQLEQIAAHHHGPHRTDRLGDAMAESYAQSNKRNLVVQFVQSRALSIIAVVVFLIAVFVVGGGLLDVVCSAGFLVLPLACVWFSRGMGNLTGIRMGLARPAITQSTPAIAVAVAGWILMFVGFAVIIYRILIR